MRTPRIASIVVAGLALAAVALLIHACQIAGPALSSTRIGERVRIEGRFLGEYDLAFERVRIDDAVTGDVVCDVVGRTAAAFDLAPGLNTPATMFGPVSHVVSQADARDCRLSAGRRYRVTAWGNNGWGRVRPTSIEVAF